MKNTFSLLGLKVHLMGFIRNNTFPLLGGKVHFTGFIYEKTRI